MAVATLPSERSFRVGLALITVAGAVWRLGYLFVVKLDDNVMLNDALYYSMQAGRNSEGDWFRDGLTQLPGAEHGPLTSLYLTPWSALPGDLVRWQRFGTTLLGIATVAVIGLVGRRLAGSVVGLLAAAIAVVYANLWINDSVIMSESLACLLVAIALLVALRFDTRPTVGQAAALGVLVGLAALARSELAILAVGFAVLAWWRSAGHARRAAMPAAVVVGLVVAIVPWSLYNLSRFEEPVLLTTNDGTTLLGANCDSTYYEDIGGWDLRCLGDLPPVGTVDASVPSLERRDRAVDYITDHLDRLPIVVVARVGRLLDLYRLDSLIALDVGEEKAEWAVWAGIVSFWVVAVMATVGWRTLRRPGPGSGDRARARWWLAVPILAVFLTATVFYGAHRIRAPAEPAIVVLAATGIVALVERRSSRPPARVEVPEPVAHSGRADGHA
ncbi:MAG: ArnT family glycosyltransferase [Ilumatobacteraceae bacterium]